MNVSPEHRPLRTAPQRLTRRRLAVAVGAVLLGGTALSLAGRPATSASAPAPAAPDARADTHLSVGVTTPQPLTLDRSVAASGSVAARDELVVGADAAGVRLVEVLVDVGAVVRRGQLLARGDADQLEAQLAQQEAQIRAAQAELAQAEANFERADRIRDSGVYSAEALQQRRTALDAAAARFELAQAQRRELLVRIAHTRVIAPADGTIARRNATVGAVVQSGQDLFRLIRDDELEWRAELPDHALQRVAPGAVVRLAGLGGAAIEGRVRLVAPTVDTRTRNGTVHVALPRGVALKAGSHVDGEIVLGSATMLTLPESVLQHRDGRPFVYVVGADGTARLTRIETGTRQRGLVEVTGGLPRDARVVATGAGFVKDGERVSATPEAQARAAATSEGAGS